MKLIVNNDRTTIAVGTWGTVNENDYEILDFEFPAELEEYNKRIVYYLGDEKVWDTIVDNKANITNAITTKGDVKAYVWCTKENTEREADTDFRTMLFDMHFYENENADGIVPTEQQVDGFNTMLTAMNAKIDEVDALEETIETAEAQRQEAEATRVSNENTRESNESTRQSNEQTRQSQEAERERRTDEAIGNIEDKTAEYNANAEEKTETFNTNASQKTNDFNANYTQKVNDFNTNASSKELAFNSNASSKTSDFNSNAETKTNAFNTNATNKTNDFNSNAAEKTTAFNDNASTKTSEFNTNAESKTSAFNDNATQKTTNFDNNASEKTDEFNTNAQEKIDEYDEHIVDYQAQIDELQEEVEELSENMPWDATEQATEISVDDAAKYSKNKLELFGNTSQDSTSGSQAIDYSEVINREVNFNDATLLISTTNFNIKADTTYYIRWIFTDDTYVDASSTLDNIRLYNGTSIQKQFGGTNMVFTSQELDGITSVQVRATSTFASTYAGKTIKALVFSSDSNKITPDTYEPYTNGASPNPDYPQDIHVVTGNNTISIQGKNLIDYSALNKYNRDLSGAPSVGSPLRYYNNSKALQFNVSVSNFVGKNIFFSFDFSHTNFRRFALDTNGNYIETFSNGGLIKENYSYITILINSNVDIPTSTNIKFMAEQGSTASDYVPYYHADYPINLGSIELCKIGDYQDYLYKENGNWYVYEAIDKRIFDGSEAWRQSGVASAVHNINLPDMLPTASNTSIYVNGISDMFKNGVTYNQLTTGTYSNYYNRMSATNDKYMSFSYENTTTTASWKEWLSNNNVTAYYVLETATSIQITDTTLISQLEAIYNHLALVKGTNHITITPSDLEPLMKLSYMQDLPSKLDNLDSRLSLLE